MRDLKPIEGSELTEYVINLLQKNNIRTALDFLSLEDTKLSKITNIPESQISALKPKLRRIYGPQVTDALHYCSPCYRTKFSTGIQSLDQLLGDEFRAGRIYEICGHSAAGKSVLCSTIALNFVQDHSAEVLYVDTKRDFSGTRLNRMLTARRVSKDEVGRLMQMIKVERCYSLRDVIDTLEAALECLKKKQCAFKLLIVDSLPAVWYLFHGEGGSRKGKALLTRCANLLQQAAKEHHLLILCVNVMVRNIADENPVEVEDRADLVDQQQQQSQTSLAPSSKPSLGKCWDAVPTIRLTIEDPFYEAMINEVSTNRTAQCHSADEVVTKNRRVVRVMKSCFTPTGAECTVCVSDVGIY